MKSVWWWRGLSGALVTLGGTLAAPASVLAGATGYWQRSSFFGDQLLALLSNPNVVYILLVLGLLGLLGEVAAGGAVFPGVTGAICLILAFVGFGQLPTNWAGVALLVVAVVLFVFDLKLPGHGMSAGGILVFGLGSVLLFTPFWATGAESPSARLNPWVIVATTGGVGAFFFFGVAAGLRAQRAPVAIGSHTLIGKPGKVTSELRPQGIVHVEGEEWTAVGAAGQTFPVGCGVRIMGIAGLVLRVERLDDAEPLPAQHAPIG